RASADFATRIAKPRSRPVPVTRLVKIRSSQRRTPVMGSRREPQIRYSYESRGVTEYRLKAHQKSARHHFNRFHGFCHNTFLPLNFWRHNKKNENEKAAKSGEKWVAHFGVRGRGPGVKLRLRRRIPRSRKRRYQPRHT